MLHTTALAMVTASKLVELETRSARPAAPVLAATDRAATRPVTQRTRRVMASALHRAANVVAPA
jgi:hypothetical protein